MADIIKDFLSLQYSTNFSLEGIEEKDINLTLPPAPELSAVVYGTVTDGTAPLPNATVKLFDSTGKPFKHTMTDINGTYTLSDIPAGTYSVGAVLTGYRLSEPKYVALVGGDTVGVDLLCQKDEALALGAIAGVLSANVLTGGTSPLAGAKITLQDALGTTVAVTYTADDGEFVFYDVADGVYTVFASADGYVSVTSAVTITGGSIANITLLMAIDTRTYNGTVSGIIKNSSGYAIAGCFVGLYRIISDGLGGTKEMLVSTTKTNTEGKYMFGNVDGGTYLVKAKMNS